jgi:hypothetical protein
VRLSVFAIDIPFPANSGARIDIYRILQALTRDGFTIQLFAWKDGSSPDLPARIDGVCEEIVYLDFRPHFSARSSPSLRHKLRVAAAKLFSFVPAICNASSLDGVQKKKILERLDAFSPDALIIEGLQCAHAVFQILKEWDHHPCPLFYRSQNREFKYNYDLARHSVRGSVRAQFYADALRLLYYEPYVFLRASATMQISYQDYVFWRRLRVGNQKWVPPLAEWSGPRREITPVYDLVMLSGWSESQKAAGLRWFIREVKPLLPAAWKIAIAGRGASPELQAECRESGCLFLGEVADPNPVLAQGKVLVNAVFGGSGFYMKMLDMIRAARPIVSTRDGLTGMASAPPGLVRVADTPAEFARALQEALADSSDHGPEAEAYLAQYSETAFARRFREIARAAGLECN